MVRSWSAPLIKPPPVDGEIPPPVADGKPRRELICETEIELKPYLHEPGLNKSETLMAREVEAEPPVDGEPPMAFSPVVIPAVPNGVVEFEIDGIRQPHEVVFAPAKWSVEIISMKEKKTGKELLNAKEEWDIKVNGEATIKYKVICGEGEKVKCTLYVRLVTGKDEIQSKGVVLQKSSEG